MPLRTPSRSWSIRPFATSEAGLSPVRSSEVEPSPAGSITIEAASATISAG